MSLKSDKLTEQMKPLLLASEEKSGIMISFQPQHMVETKVSSKIGKVKQLSILAKVSSRDGCRDSILAKGTQNLLAPFGKKQKYFLACPEISKVLFLVLMGP